MDHENFRPLNLILLLLAISINGALASPVVAQTTPPQNATPDPYFPKVEDLQVSKLKIPNRNAIRNPIATYPDDVAKGSSAVRPVTPAPTWNAPWTGANRKTPAPVTSISSSNSADGLPDRSLGAKQPTANGLADRGITKPQFGTGGLRNHAPELGGDLGGQLGVRQLGAKAATESNSFEGADLRNRSQTSLAPLKIPGRQPKTAGPLARKLETPGPASIIRQGSDRSDVVNSSIGMLPGSSRAPVQSSSFSQPIMETNQAETVSATSNVEAFEPGKVLALVGGEPIFVGDMMFEINQMIERYMPAAPEKVKQAERKKMVPRLLSKFVEAKILFKGTTADLPEGVDVEQVIDKAGEEFDSKALPQMMKSAGINSIAEFDAQLRGQGTSLKHLRRSWSIEQLTKIFVAQQISRIKEVTHRDMLEEYQKNLASYAVPAKARWEQVMVSNSKFPTLADAKKKIEALKYDLVHGANLGALAKKESHGFRASEGGRHDWTTQNALVLKTVDRAIFSLPIGELSDVVESKDGYHLIRVLERTEAGRTPFRDAQVEIKKRLVEARKRAAFAKYLERLREEIPVEYLVNDQ